MMRNTHTILLLIYTVDYFRLHNKYRSLTLNSFMHFLGQSGEAIFQIFKVMWSRTCLHNQACSCIHLHCRQAGSGCLHAHSCLHVCKCSRNARPPACRQTYHVSGRIPRAHRSQDGQPVHRCHTVMARLVPGLHKPTRIDKH